MDTSNNIEGKVIVITGASSGIGETTALHLASKGALVVLGARREDRLKALAEKITAEGGKAAYHKVDVTQKSEVEALVKHALDTFGKLDVMINNAGLMALAPLQELKVDEWERMIDINIKGVLYGVAAAYPIFQKQDSGHFINISSVAGIKVFGAGGTVYSGTKFAVSAISEGFRNEVGPKIRMTSILPGGVVTELQYGSTHKETLQFLDEFSKNISITPISIAKGIAYAIEQPENVDVNEIVIRPTSQEF
ncbi:SDR family oxidoreductase [Sediminitomix flava]|uniref:Ketoreductase domain-containing protein n=1 Tax=Sediminitomix flava TaxID=379075 RepID=A0A315Z0G9_SEDFL|nr:SDR family oxidoreductase [Sediminitomix flava]PWJ36042.1 hypothetical protein BC781_10957 [Sediminitomix flava]